MNARHYLTLTLTGLCLVTSARAETFQPLRAHDVLDRIGVATHFNYMDGAYAHPDKAAQALKYVGITHLRDQTPTPWVGGSAALSTYEYMMDQGFRFDFLALGGQFDYETTAVQLRQLEKSHPGMIEAIEGFNEVDHSPVTYNGQSGLAASKAAQASLYERVRNDPALRHLPVYDLTGADWPEPGVKRADFANAHLYAQNGNQPTVWFDGTAADARKSGLPLVVTEFGYASNPQSGWLVIGVDERTQAKGLLNGLFLGFSHGFERTYIYELVDQKPDPAMTEIEQHFGLFRVDYQPKVSAAALHHLNVLLGDPARDSGTFKTEALNLDTSRFSPGVHTLAIAKADGTRWFAFWNDTAFWDRATGSPIESQPVTITLSLPSGLKAKALYDPLTGTAPLTLYNGETSLTVNVPDHPVMLEMAP